MSIIRVNKTDNYTVMSNYHLRDMRISLKAKGLLSQMLSLPETWDYTIEGLVSINKENETSVKSALKELKEAGYLVVTKHFPSGENNGRISYEYDVYEFPIRHEEIHQETGFQDPEKQGIGNLPLEDQHVENHGQINIDNKDTEKENTEYEVQKNKESSKEKINKKKSSSANSDAIISETIQSSDFSEGVKNALTDFVQNRKELKNPVTSLGIKRLLSKLHSLSSDEVEQIEIINQSIERGYSGLFPVHQGMAQGYSTKNNSFISREKQIEMLNRLTESDINNYCREKNYSHVSASEFLGNYRKRNWMVGNSVITDWKSAVDEWEARELKRIKDKEDEEYKIYHRSYMTRCLNDKL